MNHIFTLTVNPVVDKNTIISSLVPHCKLQCTKPIYYPGGGGINVSRALKNLGGTSTAVHLAGGRTGEHLQELLLKEKIHHHTIPLVGATRENLSVTDSNSGLQYRFGFPGPRVTASEWQSSLHLVENQLKENDFLVASGKLTSGIPNNYYQMLGALVKQKNAKLILDTKGEALKHAVKTDIFLLKPNLSELASLYGQDSLSNKLLEELGKDFIANHKCKILVVSLGCRGALLVTSELLEYIPAPVVHQKNSIGAGDSMVAGMLFYLLKGKSYSKMVQFGVACGAATTMRYGTQLCRKADVQKIQNWLELH